MSGDFKYRLGALAVLTLTLTLTSPSEVAARPPAATVPSIGTTAAPELRTFVQGLVRNLNGSGDTQIQSVDPAFAQLISDNSTLAVNVPGGDFRSDPISQCYEDCGPYRLLAITTNGPGRANVRIRVGTANREPATYTLDLERVGGVWRIRDAVNGGGSARAILTLHNDCMRRFHVAEQIGRCFGLPATASHSQSTPGSETPRTFALVLLAQLRHGALPLTTLNFEISFLRLIRDAENTEPVMRGDRYTLRAVRVRPDGRAEAQVLISDEFEVNEAKLILQSTPEGWRIWDVVYGPSSLRTVFTAYNACRRAAPSPADAAAHCDHSYPLN